MKVETLLKSATFKKLPLAFREHPIFQQIKRIDKPFADYGLKNCLEPYRGLKIDDDRLRNKPLYIGFSAENVRGVWDLATMSMRGVTSCMHWKNHHATHLIGSMVDPFLGIVYISDNKMTKQGISFRKRALVRFVYRPETDDYALYLDRPYRDSGNRNPQIYSNREPQGARIQGIFKAFLAEKTKLPIYGSLISTHCYRDLRMFRSESFDRLVYPYHSFMDTALPYADKKPKYALQD